MVLKYTKGPNTVCVSYIIGCVHLNKWFMIFVNASIKSDGPIKLKNHTVRCWEKSVSFKDI